MMISISRPWPLACWTLIITLLQLSILYTITDHRQIPLRSIAGTSASSIHGIILKQPNVIPQSWQPQAYTRRFRQVSTRLLSSRSYTLTKISSDALAPGNSAATIVSGDPSTIGSPTQYSITAPTPVGTTQTYPLTITNVAGRYRHVRAAQAAGRKARDQVEVAGCQRAVD